MLKSFLLARPYAVFDAEDQKHRIAYQTFLEKNSWGSCPYQFVLEESHLDLISNINQKMVEYYIKQEFSPKKKTKARK